MTDDQLKPKPTDTLCRQPDDEPPNDTISIVKWARWCMTVCPNIADGSPWVVLVANCRLTGWSAEEQHHQKRCLVSNLNHLTSSFQGCPRSLRAEPGIQLLNSYDEKLDSGFYRRKRGDGPGTTRFG